MKQGLVIGKFLPLHQGHVALIRFAAQQCDELIVSMSYNPDDPIDASVRLFWIRETFKDMPSVRAEMVLDDFDDESLPLQQRTKLWATFIREKFPQVSVVFSSEEYGDYFAAHLGVPHKEFDRLRIQFPVSASKIRAHPFAWWDYIPPVVRPYFVKKICFYGPESTGKSVLAQKMAEAFHTEYVPEVAREIISSNNFSKEDILKIGRAQTERVIQKAATADKILICDTDLITTQIYSFKYLGVVPEELLAWEKEVTYDLYFLFDIDVPWVSDGMRDLADERVKMFSIFENELTRRNLSYTNVRGSFSEREAIVRGEITRILGNT